MICRKCGCMLESGTRICPFCGEPATLAASPVSEGMPELVLLKDLAPVPATCRSRPRTLWRKPVRMCSVFLPQWRRCSRQAV